MRTQRNPGRGGLRSWRRGPLLNHSPLIAARAKETQGYRSDLKGNLCQNSDKSPTDTKRELAKLAGDKRQEEGRKKGASEGGKTAGKGRPKDSSRKTFPKAKEKHAGESSRQAAAGTGYSAIMVRDRVKAKGGDRGNQYTGGKVAIVTPVTIADPNDRKSSVETARAVGQWDCMTILPSYSAPGP